MNDRSELTSGDTVEQPHELDETQVVTNYVDIVFDGPPDSGARLVDIQNGKRESILCGERVDRGNGTWVLRLYCADGTRGGDHLLLCFG